MRGGRSAVSDGTVALTTAYPGYAGIEHECPCAGQVYAVSEPASGWSGMTQLGPPASVSPVAGGPNVAINGQTVSVGAQDGIHILTAFGPAKVSRVTITGLATRAPRLEIKLSAGAYGAKIKSFTLTLPRTLQLSRNHKQLTGEISISPAGKVTIKAQGTKLLITLKRPAESPSLTIGQGALRTSPALTRALTALLTPSHHAKPRQISLNLTASVTDWEGETTDASINIQVSRAPNGS